MFESYHKRQQIRQCEDILEILTHELKVANDHMEIYKKCKDNLLKNDTCLENMEAVFLKEVDKLQTQFYKQNEYLKRDKGKEKL